MRYGLEEHVIEKINSIFAQYVEVKKVILYGSRAKGNYKNGSDIDLVMYGDDTLTLNVMYKIMTDLDDLLLPYMIDISIFSNISDPDVVKHIERVGVLFYEYKSSISSRIAEVELFCMS